MDFCAFRSFGLRPQGVIEVVLGQEEFSFPTVLPMAVNVVSLGDFLAPLLLTGLQGLQWQAWLNGDLLGLALVACHEGFSLQVQVWCGPTLMQNMLVAAPLIAGTLHVDMDAMPDTSLVRVTIYIPGGNTLISSRVLSVTCLRTMMETCALGELRSRFGDLRLVGFRVIPVHPVVTWNAPILTLNKEKMVLKMWCCNLMQWCSLDCICPLSTGKEPSTALADSARGSWWLNLDFRSPVKGLAVHVCVT